MEAPEGKRLRDAEAENAKSSPTTANGMLDLKAFSERRIEPSIGRGRPEPEVPRGKEQTFPSCAPPGSRSARLDDYDRLLWHPRDEQRPLRKF